MRESLPLLAVDTAYRFFSVALWKEGRVREVKEGEAFRHVEGLNLKVRNLLKGEGVRITDIGAVLITVGPGYFTSLRVAASFAKALHLTLGVPIYGFGSLQAMAVGVEDGRYIATMDARKGQVYAQTFKVEGGIPIEDGGIPLGIYDPDALPYGEYALLPPPEESLRASNLFPLYFAGLGDELEPNFSPLYLRPPDAVVNRRREA